MNKDNFIEIIEFTDPVCSWCWGSEPLLKKLETRYEGKIKVNFVMGGLVEDIRNFNDNSNGIGGDLSTVNFQIISHWLEASKRHGMPVEANDFELFSEEDNSTYPLNIAYKAAQFQNEEFANKFLRKMREAVAAEAKKANKIEVLIELAQESGLEVAKFIENFSDGSAEKAFLEDQKICREYKVQGFPTFLVKFGEEKKVILRGYQSYENINAVIKQITNNKIIENKIESNEETVLSFIKKHEKVAPVEIEFSFDISKNDTNKIIESLSNQGLIKIMNVGNGAFISANYEPMSCNPVTGICNL